MGNSKEGYVLIGTTMIIFLVFVIALFLLMIIYRKRKMEHIREVESMKEKYHREILETQVEIQKDTMQQIGRDIHDNVGQKLTLAVLYTAHLKLQDTGMATAEKISSITELINDSLHDLRELSQYLTQSSEGATGLNGLLQKELSKLNQAELCKVNFETTGKPLELSLKENNMVLRITQEFLHNSIRHAACKNIYVNVLYEKTGTTINLSDDGKGFEFGQIKERPGIGLENMKKRAALIGADFNFSSTVGKGTLLNIFIPAQS